MATETIETEEAVNTGEGNGVDLQSLHSYLRGQKDITDIPEDFEAFRQGVTTDLNISSHIHGYLVGRGPETDTPLEYNDFATQIGAPLKKKESIEVSDPSSIDPSEPSKRSGVEMRKKHLQEREETFDELKSRAVKYGESKPGVLDDPLLEQKFRDRLRKKNLSNDQIHQIADMVKGAGHRAKVRDEVGKAKTYLKYSQSSNRPNAEPTEKVFYASEDEENIWRDHLKSKGLSDEAIDIALNDSKNLYLNARASQTEDEFDDDIRSYGELRAKYKGEDYTIDEFIKEKDRRLREIAFSELSDDQKILAKANQAYDRIIKKIKDSDDIAKTGAEYRDELVKLEKIRSDYDLPKKLYDPVTEKFVSRDDAGKEALAYEEGVTAVADALSDKENLRKVWKNAYFRLKALSDEYNDPNMGFYLQEGQQFSDSPKNIVDRDVGFGFVGTGSEAPQISAYRKLKDEYIEAKKNFDGVNYALMMNADPGYIEKPDWFTAGNVAFSEALLEELPYVDQIDTDRDIIEGYVNALRDEGAYISPQQEERYKKQLAEQVGEATAASIPIMLEIAVTSAATEGIGTIPAIARNARHIKNILTGRYGKAGKLVYNMFREGTKGLISFAPTSEGAATGAGEGITAGIMETISPERFLKGKYGKLVNFALRTAGGTTGETFQEFAGDYLNNLSENGFDYTQAFKDTFGRDMEDFKDRVLVIGATSLMFSGAFNSKVLLETEKQLAEAEQTPDVVAMRAAIKERLGEQKTAEEAAGEATTEEKPKDDAKGVRTETEKPGEEQEVVPEEEERLRVRSAEEDRVEAREGEEEQEIEPTEPGKDTDVQVDQSKEFTDSTDKYSVSKTDEGVVVTNTETGKDVGRQSNQYDRVVSEYMQSEEFETGQTIEEKGLQPESGEEADVVISEQSESPQEIAMTWRTRKDRLAKTEEGKEGTIQDAIANRLGKGSITAETFIQNDDKANVTRGMRLNYFGKEGSSLDMVAQEIHEEFPNIEEGEIINEITEFIKKYPGGTRAYFKETQDSVVTGLEDRFEQITGIELNDRTADTLLGKQEAAQEETPEFEEDPDPLPFQKERQAETTRRFVEDILGKVKQTFPNIDVVTDKEQFKSAFEETGQTGDPTGFVYKGKVYINPEKAKMDTPVHEFAHVWTELSKQTNKDVYNTGIRLVKGNKELMSAIAEARPDLNTEDQIAEEALVQLIGEKGVDQYMTDAQKSNLRKLLEKIWNTVAKSLGFSGKVDWRDLGEMTLSDFTSIAAGELLSETPISDVSTEQLVRLNEKNLDKQSEGTYVKYDITYSDTILNPEKSKFQETREKIKHTRRDLTRVSGDLPKWMTESYRSTQYKTRAINRSFAINAQRLDDAISDHMKTLKKEGVSKEDRMTMIVDLKKDIHGVLNGEVPGNTLKEKYNVSDDLSDIIWDMRKDIDRLSNVLIDDGIVTSEELRSTIASNLGYYVHRSYEIHKVKPQTVEGWLAKVPQEVQNRAKSYILDSYRAPNVISFRWWKSKDGTYRIVPKNDMGVEGTPIVNVSQDKLLEYIGQGDVVSDLFLDAPNGSIHFGEPVDFSLYGWKFDFDGAEAVINEIIGKHLNQGDVFALASLSKKEVNILKRRKDIPKPIRELLGEIQDPVAAYIETGTKLANLIEYSKLMNTFLEQGEGTYFSNAPANERDPRFSVKIAAEGNKKWAPLDGYYTTPEMKKALDTFEQQGFFNMDGKIGTFMRPILGVNAFVKYGMTVLNIPSVFRNLWGAYAMGLRTGHGNPIEFAKAVSKYWKSTSKKYQTDEELQELYNKYLERGLFDEQVTYQVFKTSLQDALKYGSNMQKAYDTVRSGLGVKDAKAFFDRMYQTPDAAVKMMVFDAEKKFYKDFYKRLGDDDATADRKADKKAAQITRDTLPTYSLAPKLMRAISRNPFIGAFVTFSSEIYRNAYNQVKLGGDEIKLGKKHNDTDMVLNGYKRMGLLLGSLLVIPAMSYALRELYGVDDEDERNMRSIRAPWSKNSWTLYFGPEKGKVGERGQLVSVDLSYSDPMAIMSRPIFAAIHEEGGVLNKMSSALKETGDPFLGDEPMIKAIIEAVENENSFGSQIVNPQEDWEVVLGEKTKHVAKTMTPRLAYTVQDSYKAFVDGEDTEFGKKYDPATFLVSLFGVRFNKQDIVKNIGFKARDYNSDRLEAQKLYTKDQRREQFDKANRRLSELFHEMHRGVQAARLVGATEKEIREALRGKTDKGYYGIPKGLVDQLMRGKFVPLSEDGDKKKGSFNMSSYQGPDTYEGGFDGSNFDFNKPNPNFDN